MKGRKNVRRKIGQTDATKEGRIELRTEGSWAGKKDNVHRKEGMKRGWTDGRMDGREVGRKKKRRTNLRMDGRMKEKKKEVS